MAGISDARKRAQDKQKPKATGLAALRAKRDNGAVAPTGLVALRAKKQPSKGGLGALRKKHEEARLRSSKLDFLENGLRYHNARVLGEGKGGPWGTVDVTNGPVTVTFHNRSGSWFTDISEQPGVMKEPKHTEISQFLQIRFLKELESRGIPTTEQRRHKREEEERAQRKRLAELERKREERKQAKGND